MYILSFLASFIIISEPFEWNLNNGFAIDQSILDTNAGKQLF